MKNLLLHKINIVYSTLFMALMLTLACDNDEASDNQKQEVIFTNCDQLEVLEINFLKSQSSAKPGDTLRALIKNNCKSCTQHVYTGLIAYSRPDTLAVDVLLTSEVSPDNGQSREYLLESLEHFEIKDITRLEMYLVCDWLIL